MARTAQDAVARGRPTAASEPDVELTEQQLRALETSDEVSTIGVLLATRDDAATRRRLAERPYPTVLGRDRQRHPDLIHRATDAGAVARIAWAGFDVNAKKDGRTALHQAAWEGDIEKIRALLTAGADPSIVSDEHSSTALGWAEYAYQIEAAELLRTVTPTDSAD